MGYSQVGDEQTVDLERNIVFEPSDVLRFGPMHLHSTNTNNVDSQMAQMQ